MRELKISVREGGDDHTTQGQRSRNHCETHETYGNVLITSGKYRIAVCKLNLQWLFQRKRPQKTGAGERWDNIGYCSSRVGLMRLQRSENARLEDFIETLPKMFSAEKL